MQIQQGSALLAFPQTTTCNPYKVRVLSKTDVVGSLHPNLATVRPEPLVKPHPIFPARNF
jgi:hypothetical protein